MCKYCTEGFLPFNNIFEKKVHSPLGEAKLNLDLLFDPNWDDKYEKFALEASFGYEDTECSVSKLVQIKYCPFCGRELKHSIPKEL